MFFAAERQCHIKELPGGQSGDGLKVVEPSEPQLAHHQEHKTAGMIRCKAPSPGE